MYIIYIRNHATKIRISFVEYLRSDQRENIHNATDVNRAYDSFLSTFTHTNYNHCLVRK